MFQASGHKNNNHFFFFVRQNVPPEYLSDSYIIFTEYFSPINKSKPLTKGVLKDTFNYREKLFTTTELKNSRESY